MGFFEAILWVIVWIMEIAWFALLGCMTIYGIYLLLKKIGEGIRILIDAFRPVRPNRTINTTNQVAPNVHMSSAHVRPKYNLPSSAPVKNTKPKSSSRYNLPRS